MRDTERTTLLLVGTRPRGHNIVHEENHGRSEKLAYCTGQPLAVQDKNFKKEHGQYFSFLYFYLLITFNWFNFIRKFIFNKLLKYLFLLII